MNKKEILIIDDNQMVRNSLQTFLKSEGFSVESCESGRSALNLAKEKRFKIFIIDYNMPEMYGDEVAALLRKQYPEVIIIGYSFELKEQAFLNAGANAFIMKGQWDKQLVQLIKSNTHCET
jgi:CheY-like chemotaxis protein